MSSLSILLATLSLFVYELSNAFPTLCVQAAHATGTIDNTGGGLLDKLCTLLATLFLFIYEPSNVLPRSMCNLPRQREPSGISEGPSR